MSDHKDLIGDHGDIGNVPVGGGPMVGQHAHALLPARNGVGGADPAAAAICAGAGAEPVPGGFRGPRSPGAGRAQSGAADGSHIKIVAWRG